MQPRLTKHAVLAFWNSEREMGNYTFKRMHEQTIFQRAWKNNLKSMYRL